MPLTAASVTGMDTRTIDKICKIHTCTSGYFGGCYSADGLPEGSMVGRFPIFFIANTQPSSVKHGHWVVILAHRPNKVEFYDSLGNPPSHYHSGIGKFVDSLGGTFYVMNTVKHQPSSSNLCSLYCLYVADLWCRGFSFKHILNTFNASNLDYNDRLVSKYFTTHIYSGLVSTYV